VDYFNIFYILHYFYFGNQNVAVHEFACFSNDKMSYKVTNVHIYSHVFRLKEVAVIVPDLLVDIPKALEYISDILCPLVLSRVVPLKLVVESCALLEERKHVAVLLANTMQHCALEQVRVFNRILLFYSIWAWNFLVFISFVCYVPSHYLRFCVMRHRIILDFPFIPSFSNVFRQ